jgi:hypothetical protein
MELPLGTTLTLASRDSLHAWVGKWFEFGLVTCTGFFFYDTRKKEEASQAESGRTAGFMHIDGKGEHSVSSRKFCLFLL